MTAIIVIMICLAIAVSTFLVKLQGYLMRKAKKLEEADLNVVREHRGGAQVGGHWKNLAEAQSEQQSILRAGITQGMEERLDAAGVAHDKYVPAIYGTYNGYLKHLIKQLEKEGTE